jgi:hypothetical protein
MYPTASFTQIVLNANGSDVAFVNQLPPPNADITVCGKRYVRSTATPFQRQDADGRITLVVGVREADVADVAGIEAAAAAAKARDAIREAELAEARHRHASARTAETAFALSRSMSAALLAAVGAAGVRQIVAGSNYSVRATADIPAMMRGAVCACGRPVTERKVAVVVGTSSERRLCDTCAEQRAPDLLALARQAEDTVKGSPR